MPRPLRLDYVGAFFHIMSRGVERRTIYNDDADRLGFLKILATACERYGGSGHAYCLMRNHYHLLLESTDGRMSELMQHINGAYARWFNRRHQRVGHLFQGRFRSNLIDSETYFLEAIRYIELNPCRAGLVVDPADWSWSSYRPRLGQAAPPRFLDPEPALSRFGDGDARSRYREYLLAALPAAGIGERLRREPIVGSEEFVARHANRARGLRERQKVPRAQQLADRPSLEALFGDAADRADRRRRAGIAFADHGYKMTEIGAHLGVHYTTVSRWIGGCRCDDS